jgi:hypothetical protein
MILLAIWLFMLKVKLYSIVFSEHKLQVLEVAFHTFFQLKTSNSAMHHQKHYTEVISSIAQWGVGM